MDRLNHACGQLRLTAPPIGEGTAPAIFALSVPSVLAALAFLPDAGDERTDILRGQLGQPLLAQARDQMQPDDTLVALVRLRPPVLLHHVAQPVGQVLRDRQVHRGHWNALVGSLHQLGQLLARILMTPGVALNALVGARGSERIGGVAVAAVFPQPNAAFTVCAPPLATSATAGLRLLKLIR